MSPTEDTTKSEDSVAFLLSAEMGDLQALKRWLDAGVSPNACEDSGWTALHTAASQGNPVMASMLLQAGANPNAACQDGWTPVCEAAKRQQVEILEQLLERGGRTDRPEPWSAFQTALRAKARAEVFHCLIPWLDHATTGPRGTSLLRLSIAAGHLDAVQALLDAGEQGPMQLEDDLELLELAGSQAKSAIFIAVLLHFQSRLTQGQLSRILKLQCDMGNRHRQAIELLLAAGADPLWHDDCGTCAVQSACAQGNAALLMQLTRQQAGAIPPAACDWLIQGARAAVEQHEKQFSKSQWAQGPRALHEWDADPRRVLQHYLECLDYLQTRIALPASTDLLLLSIAADNFGLFQQLLEIGTHPEAKSSWNRLPLIEAIGYGRGSPYLDRLLAAGVDVNRTCPRGDTPLLTAIKVNHSRYRQAKSLIPRLLAIGATVDLASLDEGVTPLMLAIRQNNLDATRLLLEAGANLFLADHSGHFAYHCARGASRKFMRLLEQQHQKVFVRMKMTADRDHDEEYE
jgi:ankyrin repeat protein